MKTHDPMADFTRFGTLVRDRLADVLRKYAFEEVDAQILYPGMWIVFRNSTTQLTLNFEYVMGLWAAIGRLGGVGDRLRVVEGYGLNELLSLRAPEKAVFPAMDDFDDTTIRNVLDERATALEAFAGDVLRGDFSVFPQLARLRPQRPTPDTEVR